MYLLFVRVHKNVGDTFKVSDGGNEKLQILFERQTDRTKEQPPLTARPACRNRQLLISL